MSQCGPINHHVVKVAGQKLIFQSQQSTQVADGPTTLAAVPHLAKRFDEFRVR